MRTSLERLVLAVLVMPVSARAGVLYTVDVGTAGLGQGGAFVAAPDDASAVWYNPAALATQRGLRLDLDGGLSASQLEFDQADAGGPIKSQGSGLLPVGLIGASYDFHRSDLTAGLFAYVPSSSSFNYDPKGQQRFEGIGGSYKLAFFHAAIAYRIANRLSIGVALGPTYFHAIQYNGVSIAQAGQDPSDPFWAVTVTTDVKSHLFLSSNLGISYAPSSRWALGASVMPPLKISASGTLHLESPLVDSEAQINGDTVDLQLQLPTIVRLGARYWLCDDLSVELAGVYEGWARFSSIHLDPHISVGAPTLDIATVTVPPFDFVKDYNNVYSLRAGSNWDRGSYALRGGAYFETAGSPPDQFDITAPEAKKIGLTVGATFRLTKAISLDAALAHTFFWDVGVTNSQIQILNVLLPANTATIGNGTYHMSMDFAQLALRYQR